ncbi:hypothetical protein OBBRIDRAFT_496265 [Obba rivulosa]|uniref:Uncharacterized protein n=1 Tax=Obba rivulosa TaxID=1052685 RepID=A0A8E2DTH8_9APHY|nr:hypothetical protein OBBRIDRAFT_496265 [Obba rivulosa]
MSLSTFTELWAQLRPRKGGGGGHASSHSSSKGGSSSSKGGSTDEEESSGSSGKSSSSGRSPSVPLTGATGSKKYQYAAYSSGGGSTTTIPAGQPFAGRIQGGGMRTTIYGSRTYGSGYPGATFTYIYIYDPSPPFPYVFWPVSWGPGYGYGPSWWHTTIVCPLLRFTYNFPNDAAPQYGLPSNTSRPGGPMAEATFTSNSTNSTFHILSDNSTVASLITSITLNCTLGPGSSTFPLPYNGTNTSEPVPEQAIQYYRASTVALTLDGYNNTNAFTQGPNATANVLPSWVDNTLLNCLNATIGEAVPLVTVDQPHKTNVSAIVAGVIGGAIGLLVLICILLRCYERGDRYHRVIEKDIEVPRATWRARSNSPTLGDDIKEEEEQSVRDGDPSRKTNSFWSRLNPARLWKR